MTYGIELRNSTGAVVMDMGSIGIQFIEALTIPYGTSGSKTYTELTGRTIKIFQMARTSHSYTTTVNGASNPVFNYTARTSTKPQNQVNSTFVIFAS
jgi:hypothetical protein